VVVAGERLARYGFGDGHPFGPDRHAAFMGEFAKRGLDRRVRLLETRAATREELQSFHTARYLDFVAERSRSGEGYLDSGDTPAWRGVYEVERLRHRRVVRGRRLHRAAAIGGECVVRER
jgi:acetoin utilization protein AcuC